MVSRLCRSILQRLRAATGSKLAILRSHLAIHQRVIEWIEQPVIYGDGEHSRDFTYIDNVVEANLKAAETTKGIGSDH